MLKEALLYDKLDYAKVQCLLCAHKCVIADGATGICKVRQNKEGVLYSLVYGKAIAAHIDPIEKKPLYHFFPGSESFSIATPGCNFECGFCQNWQISQVSSESILSRTHNLSPQDVVELSLQEGCRSISYTYTEPTIFFEYAYEIAKLAKKKGLYNNFVTNGYMGKEVLLAIKPYLDAANVDLKSFREDFYKKMCKARLGPVLESIRYMKELGIWIEVTTLIIPDENDSDDELKDIAAFIADVGVDIPWHISSFHPDYKLENHKPTQLQSLQRAYDFGKEAGLRYVYLGNVLEGNETYCYNCFKTIIKRSYFTISQNNIKDSRCSFCGALIDGFF